MKKLLLVALLACLATTVCAANVLAQGATSNQRARREVAVTFDDLPATQGDVEQMKSITTRLLRSITANKVPAIGFVNEIKLYVNDKLDTRRSTLLRMWLDAGLELGNHTFSHGSPNVMSLAAYQEDVIRGETITKGLLREKGMRLRYFRHPQLQTGPTFEYKSALDAFLAERAYRIAPVTVDNNDFIFAYVYADAKSRGDKETMKRVADAYIPYMEQIFDFFEKLSVESFGYEIKQTLLLHANEINADHFDDLVRLMKTRGYKFIPLEDALKDKVYSLPDAQDNSGLSWIHRWRLAKGLEMQSEPSEPEFVTSSFKTIYKANSRRP